MPFIFKRLALLTSIAVVLAPNKAPAGDKEKEDKRFQAEAAASYPAHQTSEKVTIGIKPYFNDDEVKPVFGKHNPYTYGVLPVLVVIQNDTGKTLRLSQIQVAWMTPDHDRIDATPAKDVRFLAPVKRPTNLPGPPGVPKIGGGHKNPLDTWEIEGRAFAAEMLTPGQSASGFFYFQTGYQRGASVYISGLKEAQSGHELLYFEIPVSEK